MHESTVAMWKPYVKGFVGMIVALVFAIFAYAVWVDHERTTAMWTFLNQQQAAKQPTAQVVPMPQSPPAK